MLNFRHNKLYILIYNFFLSTIHLRFQKLPLILSINSPVHISEQNYYKAILAAKVHIGLHSPPHIHELDVSHPRTTWQQPLGAMYIRDGEREESDCSPRCIEAVSRARALCILLRPSCSERARERICQRESVITCALSRACGLFRRLNTRLLSKSRGPREAFSLSLSPSFQQTHIYMCAFRAQCLHVRTPDRRVTQRRACSSC